MKSGKNHQATNSGDGHEVKVPCQLFFLDEEKFIIIPQEKLYFCNVFKIYLEV